MNLLSAAILVALLAVSAGGLALTLSDQGQPPLRRARLDASAPFDPREARPIPCPTRTPSAYDPGALDPGILAPTPATPFTSRMPAGGQHQCFWSMPPGR
ncbi:MAG: hypothetical protein AB7P33_11675 [Dehalococcoidia bacterium]